MTSKPTERDAADYQLVQRCLDGDEQAWQTLVDKYKRLVFSVALAYGNPSRADAIFEAVWSALFENLESLELSISFRHRLTTLSLQTALHATAQNSQVQEPSGGATSPQIDPKEVSRIDQEQILRECIESLPLRCRECVRMLFFHTPPLPCSKMPTESGQAAEIAAGRCLHELMDKLMALGFMD